MKAVKFYIAGQFGNNLFQYFAAEIIKKIYQYDTTTPTQIINLDFNTVISDELFIKITQEYMRGNILPIDTSKDILLMGFFQRSDIFEYERDYIRSLFTINNTSYISTRTQVCNILKYKTKHTIQPTEKDLTLHVRLGDFYDKSTDKSQIYNPEYLKGIIKSIQYDKLYIVCDTPKEEWEETYLKTFDELNPIRVSGLLGDDFDFLLNSYKLVTSASTLCWLGAMLSQKATEVHIPYNNYYGGYEYSGQSLAEFSDACKVYYDTTYWKPLLQPSQPSQPSQSTQS